jgi:hypothetical protein
MAQAGLYELNTADVTARFRLAYRRESLDQYDLR